MDNQTSKTEEQTDGIGLILKERQVRDSEKLLKRDKSSYKHMLKRMQKGDNEKLPKSKTADLSRMLKGVLIEDSEKLKSNIIY
ncbi:hypothetical protein AVEN_100744-1 [Araneus ventricosus]|uniref:Uncharacterized protein n=1 Tax=Araneus ventricosus TaxID=182803 RepID=A0A4Y2PHW9_ARAVE|nr:hypothetical protein AVEN_100744-1 [Araneus ventricosus]